MDNKQVIEHLKSTKDFQTKCVEVLDIAIKALEGTAFEAPVQEQLINEALVDYLVEKFAFQITSALNN